MAKRLYLVSLVDRQGNMLAGGHFMADDAAHARAIGHTHLTDLPDLDGQNDAFIEGCRAKLKGWYAVKAVPSKADPRNAMNAVVA